MLDDLLFYDNFKKRSGINLVGLDDIFRTLYFVSRKGSLRGKSFVDFIENAFDKALENYYYFRYSKEIIDIVALWLKEEKKMSTNVIVSKIQEVFRNTKHVLYDNHLNAKLLSRILKGSEIIQFSWQECKLKNLDK